MQRELTLIRHAKSDWDDPLFDDHDRTLNARGHEAANAMGNHLAAQGYGFDLVLCSDAERTRETAQLLLGAMGYQGDVTFLTALYLASADQMLAQINRHDPTRLAVIGHNPGIATLAARLAKTPPHHPRFRDHPTCAVTTLRFEGQIKTRAGEVIQFIIPADLTV